MSLGPSSILKDITGVREYLKILEDTELGPSLATSSNNS
jgi:hypothetical protein